MSFRFPVSVSGPAPETAANRIATGAKSAALERMLAWLLGGVLALRVLTLGMYPLTDTTEARYAEIARKMLETGQWIVPQIDYGTPFWGKPPLSFWLTALSFKLFGVSEFAARLPAFLLVLAGFALVAGWARELGMRSARVMLVGMSCALAFVSAGVVETDPALFFATTLSMLGFWRAVQAHSRTWGWMFFAGIGIGLLAKGPVAVVVIGLACGAWTLWSGQWRAVSARLPWASGTALAALIAVPWYVAAELRSPGFLHYFLIGEHVQRFLVPGWKGDLYGSGHAYPRGTIWLYLLAAALPWSPLLLWRVAKSPELRASLRNDRLNAYLLSWLLAPALFFTLARNILPAYVLPGLAALPLLLERSASVQAPAAWRRWLLFAAAMPLLFMAALQAARSGVEAHSQRDLIAQYRAQAGQRRATLVYFGKRPGSAVFYSRGEAAYAPTLADLQRRLQQPGANYVAMPRDAWAMLSPQLRQTLSPAPGAAAGTFILLQERAASSR